MIDLSWLVFSWGAMKHHLTFIANFTNYVIRCVIGRCALRLGMCRRDYDLFESPLAVYLYCPMSDRVLLVI